MRPEPDVGTDTGTDCGGGGGGGGGSSSSYSAERSAMRVYMGTNVDPAPGSPEDSGVTAGRVAPSLLKSMLQKAVRRGRGEVRVCVHV
jgi:hypothetical protein